MTWFDILKGLSWISEDDDICCSEARKKYLDLFAERFEDDTADRIYDVLHYIKDLSCEDLQKLSIIKIPRYHTFQFPTNDPHEEPVDVYKLTINTKIGIMEIMLNSEKADRIHEIKEQWRECENRLM